MLFRSNKLTVIGGVSATSFTSSITNAIGFLGTSSYSSASLSSSYALTSSYSVSSSNAISSSYAGVASSLVGGIGASVVSVLNNGWLIEGTINVVTNSWNHIAVTFTTGTNAIAIYVNGIPQTVTTTGTASYSAATASYVPAIGRWQYSTAGSYFPGNISNLRVTKQLVYSGNFTPSTSPLTTTSQGVTASNVTVSVV